MPLKKRRNFLLFLLVLVGSTGLLRAESPDREYQLKAAFLVNFARFIIWPDRAFPTKHSEFTFCLFGDNPFGSALDGIEKKKIGGRECRVEYMGSIDQIGQCHLLYVSGSERPNLDRLIPAFSRHAVVTVSDIPGFADKKGAIELVQKQDRLTFIINNSILKQQGISADSSLLDLAASVR